MNIHVSKISGSSSIPNDYGHEDAGDVCNEDSNNIPSFVKHGRTLGIHMDNRNLCQGAALQCGLQATLVALVRKQIERHAHSLCPRDLVDCFAAVFLPHQWPCIDRKTVNVR